MKLLQSRTALRRQMLVCHESIGIPLRHTHGTLLHSQGTPLKVAQAQLGHSHMATALEIYTHASASAQRDAVLLLEIKCSVVFPSSKEAKI